LPFSQEAGNQMREPKRNGQRLAARLFSTSGDRALRKPHGASGVLGFLPPVRGKGNLPTRRVGELGYLAPVGGMNSSGCFEDRASVPRLSHRREIQQGGMKIDAAGAATV